MIVSADEQKTCLVRAAAADAMHANGRHPLAVKKRKKERHPDVHAIDCMHILHAHPGVCACTCMQCVHAIHVARRDLWTFGGLARVSF